MKYLLFLSLIFALKTQAQDNLEGAPGTQLVPTKESSWQFALGGSLSLSSSARFDSITVSNTAGTLTAQLDYSNSISLELEARNMKANSWGFVGGLSLDREQEITGGTISGAGSFVVLTGGNPSKIQTNTIYGSAVYRWNQFYLPFGLNISSVKYTPPSGYTGTASAKGGVGGQLGVGYYFSENFALEGHSRAIGLKLSGANSGSTFDYGDGFLSRLVITGKYIF